jgi:hypothetical protein
MIDARGCPSAANDAILAGTIRESEEQRMPRDGSIPINQMTAAAKLLHLADFMETLNVGQLDLRTVHHTCGAAHCAWGWGEVIGLFPRSGGAEDDSEWAAEMTSAEQGRSVLLGLTYQQFRHCFGIGYQFRSLGCPYTPTDVARHLRQTASELETDGSRNRIERNVA